MRAKGCSTLLHKVYARTVLNNLLICLFSRPRVNDDSQPSDAPNTTGSHQWRGSVGQSWVALKDGSSTSARHRRQHTPLTSHATELPCLLAGHHSSNTALDSRLHSTLQGGPPAPRRRRADSRHRPRFRAGHRRRATAQRELPAQLVQALAEAQMPYGVPAPCGAWVR